MSCGFTRNPYASSPRTGTTDSGISQRHMLGEAVVGDDREQGAEREHEATNPDPAHEPVHEHLHRGRGAVAREVAEHEVQVLGQAHPVVDARDRGLLLPVGLRARAHHDRRAPAAGGRTGPDHAGVDRTPTRCSTAAATRPIATGPRKLRVRLSIEARRQAMSGPTPIRKMSERKRGTFTWLKNGAPTLTLTPRIASLRSGKTVPKKTVNAAATRKTL